MTNIHFDEEKLAEISEGIMFESVKREVDMSRPEESRKLINEIVGKVLGADHPQREQYEEEVVSSMHRDITLDETSADGYFKRMRGARANEYRNLDATRK